MRLEPEIREIIRQSMVRLLFGESSSVLENKMAPELLQRLPKTLGELNTRSQQAVQYVKLALDQLNELGAETRTFVSDIAIKNHQMRLSTAMALTAPGRNLRGFPKSTPASFLQKLHGSLDFPGVPVMDSFDSPLTQALMQRALAPRDEKGRQ